MDKMKCETGDGVERNVDRIAALFPQVVTEVKGEDGKIKRAVKWDVLKELLSGEYVEGGECYDFTWPGKRAAIAEAARHPQDAAPLQGGEQELGHHREPLHRGRQPRCSETPAGVLSRQGQDDLHRSAIQHRQRLHLSG